MPLGEIQIRKINEPIPEPKVRPRRRDELFPALEAMEVGDSLEVNRTAVALESYGYWFRRDTNRREWRFKIRESERLGWAKIWRVA